MPSKPSPKDQEFRLDLIAQAAQNAGRPDVARKARKAASELHKLAQKAMREGKGGMIKDGKGGFVIVEK